MSGCAQPFGNRAAGLWKTLATWMEISEVQHSPIDASVSFLLVTNTSVPSCIARRIADAASQADVEVCVGQLHRFGEEAGDLTRLVDEISPFVLPLLFTATAEDPFKARWSPGGPWK